MSVNNLLKLHFFNFLAMLLHSLALSNISKLGIQVIKDINIETKNYLYLYS